MGLLPPGAEVEVRLDGKGYYGIWFKATVVGFAAARGRHAPARYSITFDGDGDIRRFAPTHVRPRPPAPESPPCILVHDVIEVFHERGWWSGLVLSADTRSVTVAFPITREVITYVPRLVRPRRDYVDGDWVPSRAVVAVRPKREIRRYMVGELVEVVREREMWFPAKVAKVIDEFSYIVEYSDQNGEEGGRSEYLHWQFIRPAVQHLPPENEFHRRTERQDTGQFQAGTCIWKTSEVTCSGAIQW
ncbi:protein AGENET DOMAIN (AGD)-CONTAINING P1-like isoform X2 [Miscanthus floridulus]|uniref:protein AGENET DOMAIN (AGD)-CONTAINING P1-like isoform X2 n=1 Tax=Miscanthus floridulus TaxID=154761 RepID=UPI00345A37DB